MRAVLAGMALIWASAGMASPDISGTWWIKDRSETAAIDHAALPLRPAARAEYERNKALIAARKPVPAGQGRCLPEGLPRIMLARYPLQILQRPEQVTFLIERMHSVRFVYIAEQHPTDPNDVDPTFMGSSVGRWEGGALLVDTISIKPNSVLDSTGIPHSDAMRVRERFAVSPDGATLTDEVTVDDPKSFTRPWSFTIAYARRSDVELMQDVCVLGSPDRDHR